MIPDPPVRLHALFIGNSYMNRQERIVPALLRPLGYEFSRGGRAFYLVAVPALTARRAGTPRLSGP